MICPKPHGTSVAETGTDPGIPNPDTELCWHSHQIFAVSDACLCVTQARASSLFLTWLLCPTEALNKKKVNERREEWLVLLFPSAEATRGGGASWAMPMTPARLS